MSLTASDSNGGTMQVVEKGSATAPGNWCTNPEYTATAGGESHDEGGGGIEFQEVV